MKIEQIDESRIDEFKEEWLAASDGNVRWDPKMYAFGLFLDEELSGYIKFEINGGVGHLHDIIVKKKIRGQKYGHELMKFFMDFCKKAKCHKLTLKTSAAHKAISFYEKLGFAKEAELKDDKFHVNWYFYSMRVK